MGHFDLKSASSILYIIPNFSQETNHSVHETLSIVLLRRKLMEVKVDTYLGMYLHSICIYIK